MEQDDISHEFVGADLGDVRRNKRLLKVASALAKSPAKSISAAQGGWAESMAAFRLLNSKEITPEALLAPHQEAIVQRCSSQSCVLVSQDTTELDYSAMTQLEGMGPLNDEGRRGLFLHSLYVVSADGLPLGLLDFKAVIRSAETFGQSKSTHKRKPIEKKESLRWVEGYRRTTELARRLPHCEVIGLSDREGDIYEAFEAWHHAAIEAPGQPRAGWIIRGNHNRALATAPDGQEDLKLHGAVENAPLLGTTSFDMTARTAPVKRKGITRMERRSARTVTLEIRSLKVTLQPPKRPGGLKLPGMEIGVVLVQETGAPKGEEPLRWLLLTSLEVGTFEQALRVVEFYCRRWDIEVFHRVLKTGCKVERVQLKTGQALLNALALYTVIAWRILYVTHLGRICPDLPCGCVFAEEEWKAACKVVRRKSEAEPTLNEFIGIVGKLGGHLGRKSDGPPGPQAIWEGLSRVRDFACMWEAIYGADSRE